MRQSKLDYHWQEVVAAHEDRATLIEQAEHRAAVEMIRRADELDRKRLSERRSEAPSRNGRHRVSDDHRKSGGMVTIEHRRKFRSG